MSQVGRLHLESHGGGAFQPPHKILACGCVLGYERCFDCRPGLDLDQEKALHLTVQEQGVSMDSFIWPMDGFVWFFLGLVIATGILGGLLIYAILDWSAHH